VVAVLLRGVDAIHTTTGRAMSAGLLSLDWPDDSRGGVWHACCALRGYRGDGHIAAYMRALPEGHVATLAAGFATRDQVAHIRRMGEIHERAMDSAVPGDDETARCNTEFHAATLAASGSPRLTNLLDVISSAPMVPRPGPGAPMTTVGAVRCNTVTSRPPSPTATPNSPNRPCALTSRPRSTPQWVSGDIP